MIKSKLRIILAAILVAFSLSAVPALAASSNPLDKACQGLAAKSPVCNQSQDQNANPSNPIAGPNGIISKAANIIATVAGIGAVIMILIGSFEFVTAGGTGFKSASANPAPTKAAKARSRVSSALIGLVVIALAWAIVRLITDKVLK